MMARPIRLRTGCPARALYRDVLLHPRPIANSSTVHPRTKISNCSLRTSKRPVDGSYSDPRLVIPGIDGIEVVIQQPSCTVQRASVYRETHTETKTVMNQGVSPPHSSTLSNGLERLFQLRSSGRVCCNHQERLPIEPRAELNAADGAGE
jgi:hypothetical protein